VLPVQRNSAFQAPSQSMILLGLADTIRRHGAKINKMGYVSPQAK
jgi:hypothetical protein